MSNAPKQPLVEPTVRGVLASAIGATAADQAIDALVLHMTKHFSGGDAPAVVLRRGALQFAELRKVPA